MLIKELLQRQAHNKVSNIIFGEESISYQILYRRVVLFKKKLGEIDGEISQCIIIMLPNSINYVVAYFTVAYMDRVIVPINPKSTIEELKALLKYCNSNLIITNNTLYNKFLKEIGQFEKSICIVNIDQWDEQMLIGELRLDRDEELKDVAILLHTSGTTSRPKRVMLTHRNLITNIESNIQSLNLTSKDKTLIGLPMYFGYCNTAQFLTHVYLGADIVIMDQIFMAKKFHEIVERKKITNFTGVPTMLRMLEQYKFYRNYNFKTLRCICFGGGNFESNRLCNLIKKYNTVEFIHTYGQTECSPRVTMLPAEYALKKLGSVGKAIPNVEVRIINAEGSECFANEVGEIEVKSMSVMKGYYRNPVETAKVKKGEWLCTGDLGYLDDEGFLFLTGRKKNIIISGGINIYPEEIEQVLLQFSGIKEVCVFGEKDEWYGEVPVAKIVADKEGVNEEKIKKFCEERIVGYKIPKKIIFVKQLEKTYNGKIIRKK